VHGRTFYTTMVRIRTPSLNDDSTTLLLVFDRFADINDSVGGLTIKHDRISWQETSDATILTS
jgi:hypothetical protein